MESITPTASVSASAGGIANYVLNLTTQGNTTNADLALSVGGLPAGATAQCNPATINNGTGSSTLSVLVPAGALAPGTYNLLITVTGSGVIVQSAVTLAVSP